MSLALSSRVRLLPISPTLAIQELVRRSKGRIRQLGFGQSPFPPPPFLAKALEGTSAAGHHYQNSAGLPELRESIARKYNAANRRRGGSPVEWSSSDVLVGPGTKELMFGLNMAVSAAKTTFLFPQPHWVSYVPQAELAGNRHRSIQTRFENGWHADAADVQRVLDEEAGRHVILYVNDPLNPTGTVMSQKQRADIAELARERNGQLTIFSDEIYGGLVHESHDRSGASIPFHMLAPEHTITTNGLSKWAGAGGWRLGWMVLPPTGPYRALSASMTAFASEVSSCASVPVQEAALTVFAPENEKLLRQHLHHQREVLKTVGTWTYKKLSAAGVKVARPQGAYYLFLDMESFRKKLNCSTAHELCDRLANEANVAILAAPPFGFSEDRLCARLSYVEFDGASAIEKVAAGKTLTPEEDFPLVKEGIESIVDFLQKL